MKMNTERQKSGLFLPKAPALVRARTHDDLLTFDSATIDSTGAFLVNELERLDPTLHEPLAAVTWSRDIDLREDVSIADETSSFTNSTFAAAGGINPNGKAWIGKDSTQIANMALDISKTPNPLYLWGMELGYSIPELESAQKLGRPVDQQKLEGIKLKHNMDIDEMVYIGDTDMGKFGLVNNTTAVTNNGNATTGAWMNGSTTPAQILADVNELLTSVWKASGYAVCPSKLLVPPAIFGYLASTIISIGGVGGGMSILTFLRNNSIALATNGKELDVLPLKWLTGRGSGGTAFTENGHGRMVAYTKAKDRVRYPLVPLQRTPLEYRSIYHMTTYFGRLGCMEFVYPETIGYRDSI
jgi:hypothetical protein